MMTQTLVDHVRDAIRCAYLGTGEEFRLYQVYSIADVDSDQFPPHRNRKVRHAVMRQMLQDERKPKGLIFVRAGLYKYPLASVAPPTLAATRQEAVDRGDRLYHRASPCPRCETSVNYASTGSCKNCQNTLWSTNRLRVKTTRVRSPAQQSKDFWGGMFDATPARVRRRIVPDFVRRGRLA